MRAASEATAEIALAVMATTLSLVIVFLPVAFMAGMVGRFFHSFGLTGGLLLPLFAGVRTFLYPSPLHYKLIPEVARKARPTITFATDTFLAGYAKQADDEDFASLRLVVAGADGSEPIRLTDGVNDSWPSWSPDGSKIVFSSTWYDPLMEQCTPGWPNDFRCATDLYVMDADGSNIVRITDDPAPEFMPAWSPDGDRIAFVRTTGGTAPRIFTTRPDGSDVRQISSGDGGSDYWPSWSPDGSQIVFTGFRYEESGIWIVDEDGSNEHQIFGQRFLIVEFEVALSPNKKIVNGIECAGLEGFEHFVFT